MRVEPQVSLPAGRVARYSTVRLADGCDERQIDGYDDVKPLRVDRYTVTNGDFMYEHVQIGLKLTHNHPIHTTALIFCQY